MKLIPVRGGDAAMVDDCDYEYLSKWKWRVDSHGAARRSVKLFRIDGKNKFGTTVFMHRDIMNPPDNMTVDHINRNPLDNRRANMRICSSRDNNRNRGYGGHGLGVAKHKGGWQAVISHEGKKKYIGLFKTPKEAEEAYIKEHIKLYGTSEDRWNVRLGKNKRFAAAMAEKQMQMEKR